MKGKATLFFLMLFAALQIYFAREPVVHQVVGSTWTAVSRHPGRLVEREQQYYLIEPRQVYHVRANSVHLGLRSIPVTWEDVPQPTGQGIWKVAYTLSGIPLFGTGGRVYPSSAGSAVIWQAGGQGELYESARLGAPVHAFASGLSNVRRVLWAPDGAAVAIQAMGSKGPGIYVLDGDRNATPIIPESAILDFGFTDREAVLAALDHGAILWQGHAAVRLPRLDPIYVDNGLASVWGVHDHQSVLWLDSATRQRPSPDQRFFGAAQFSSSGAEVAVLADQGSRSDLYLDGTKHQLSVRLPYDLPITDYHLAGFVGNHWVLVSITHGIHQGTFGWWVNRL